MQVESTTKMGAAQIAIVIMPNIIKSEHLNTNPAMAIMNANAEKDFVNFLLDLEGEAAGGAGVADGRVKVGSAAWATADAAVLMCAGGRPVCI